jgi:hypothetical protein
MRKNTITPPASHAIFDAAIAAAESIKWTSGASVLRKLHPDYDGFDKEELSRGVIDGLAMGALLGLFCLFYMW